MYKKRELGTKIIDTIQQQNSTKIPEPIQHHPQHLHYEHKRTTLQQEQLMEMQSQKSSKNYKTKQLNYQSPMIKSPNAASSSTVKYFTITSTGDLILSVFYRLNLTTTNIQKALLVMTKFTTNLANYQSNTYPNIIYLTASGVSGYYQKSGIQTSIVATATPQGGISAINNPPANIMGFNLTYNISQQTQYEISGRSIIDFNILIGGSQTPAVYPLSQQFTMQFMIVQVML